MNKSQFNIKISTDLLTRVKRQAIMSGKSLTEHITDLVTKSLSENYIQDDQVKDNKRFMDLEKRIILLESIVGNREYISKKLEPFTNSEAENCTRFMKGLFDQEVEKRNFEEKNQAFNDFLQHVNSYSQLNKHAINRLQEIMLSDKPSPWTGDELNNLTSEGKCHCPIRIGLINWTGKIDCPSQQEICDKGEKLLPLF